MQLRVYETNISVCVKYDTGAEEDGKNLEKKFNVQAYPTFLLLNSNQGLRKSDCRCHVIDPS